MGVKISNEDGTMKVIVQLDTKQAENNLKDFSETFNRTIGNLQQSKGIKETLDDMETFAKDIQFLSKKTALVAISRIKKILDEAPRANSKAKELKEDKSQETISNGASSVKEEHSSKEANDTPPPPTDKQLKTAYGQLDKAENDINSAKSWIVSTDALVKYKEAKVNLQEVEKAHNDELKRSGKESEETKAAAVKLEEAQIKLGKAKSVMLAGYAKDLGNLNSIIGGVGTALTSMGVKGAEEITKNVGGILSGGMEALTGGPIGMVTGGIKILSSAFGLFRGIHDKKLQSQIAEYQEQLDGLSKSYDKLQQSISNATGMEFYDNSESSLNNIAEQENAIKQMMSLEQEKKKKDENKIKEYEKQLDGLEQKRESIEKSMTQMRLQADVKQMSQTISNALFSAFDSGQDAIGSLDETFDKFIKNALMNSLKLRLIAPVVEKMLKDIDNHMEANGNSLKGLDLSKYKDELTTLSEDISSELESAYADLGLTTSTSKATQKTSGLLSSVQRELTEATASELSGLYRSTYDLMKVSYMENQVQGITLTKQLEIANGSLIVLNSIQINTADTVVELKNTVTELKNVNKNLGGKYVN
jgi:DNA repair exonuclease SbcCD ATPase subunit